MRASQWTLSKLLYFLYIWLEITAADLSTNNYKKFDCSKCIISLKSKVCCLAPQTMSVEMSVSAYELTCCGRRTNLGIEFISDILIIRNNSPTVTSASFLLEAAKRFVSKTQVRSVGVETDKKQLQYKNFFNEARDTYQNRDRPSCDVIS